MRARPLDLRTTEPADLRTCGPPRTSEDLRTCGPPRTSEDQKTKQISEFCRSLFLQIRESPLAKNKRPVKSKTKIISVAKGPHGYRYVFIWDFRGGHFFRKRSFAEKMATPKIPCTKIILPKAPSGYRYF